MVTTLIPFEVLKSLALGTYNGANGFAVACIDPPPVSDHE